MVDDLGYARGFRSVLLHVRISKAIYGRHLRRRRAWWSRTQDGARNGSGHRLCDFQVRRHPDHLGNATRQSCNDADWISAGRRTGAGSVRNRSATMERGLHVPERVASRYGFGLVMGFLEGRRVTELLSAGLCASFIVADGATKSVGAWLLALGVSQFWMPAMAGAMFLMPLVGFVTMLARIPPPNEKDLEARSERVQMKAADRWLILKRYRSGLIALVLMYLMVTILRSLRADFAAEIWRGLGESAAPAQFTTSEMIIAFCVL